MKKKIPKFRSKEEAALFWENHEILDYLDPDEFKVVRPGKSHRYAFTPLRVKDRKQLISIRIDTRLLEKAKSWATRQQTAYQAVLRKWLERGAPGYRRSSP